MNRREMFKRVFSVGLTPAAVTVAAGVAVAVTDQRERPLSAVHPVCPRCGRYVYFTRLSNFVGDLVPVECGGGIGDPCGWRGVSPVAQ